jgi:hypothetical protein
VRSIASLSSSSNGSIWLHSAVSTEPYLFTNLCADCGSTAYARVDLDLPPHTITSSIIVANSADVAVERSACSVEYL